MGIAAAILIVLCIYLLVKDISHLQNARELKRQVEYLADHDTNAELHIAAPERCMEDILRTLNRLLRQTRERQLFYKRKELELRRQMSNISHDLRTPLTSIIGYLALAKDTTVPEEERQQYLKIVERRAQALQDLIAGVYDLSRIEEERYLLAKEPVKVSQVLYDVLALYYNEFEEREYIPDIQIQENVPDVIADRKAMVRIYSNIMQNVLRHGKRYLRVIVKNENGQIVTLVENDSEEIKKEDLQNIFDRFYMADRVRSGENTGLGLAIVKSLTEYMGGHVEAVFGENSFGIKIIWPVKEAA